MSRTPRPGVHGARITPIASRSASTDSPAERRGPPIASADLEERFTRAEEHILGALSPQDQAAFRALLARLASG